MVACGVEEPAVRSAEFLILDETKGQYIREDDPGLRSFPTINRYSFVEKSEKGVAGIGEILPFILRTALEPHWVFSWEFDEAKGNIRFKTIRSWRARWVEHSG